MITSHLVLIRQTQYRVLPVTFYGTFYLQIRWRDCKIRPHLILVQVSLSIFQGSLIRLCI